MTTRTIVLCFTGAVALTVQPLVAQYTLVEAFPSLPTFTLPVELVRANDGSNRLFVLEQRGRILAFSATPAVNTTTTFLDLSDKVSQTGSETGLLGIAFHPNYASNGYFYLNYTATVSGQLKSFVVRYQRSPSNPDSALKGSELVLFTVNQPYVNHNGGKLAFGPDGYLYCAFGDGGSGGDPGNNAQNLYSMLGKILRIDVDNTVLGKNYGIPATNPFAGSPVGYKEEIFAFGLRNVWKFSFDAPTGRLWAADVGQDQWEEVDTIVAGGNYGWRVMEGNHCYNPSSGCNTAGLMMPVWDYSHTPGDESITGGFVYHGTAIPALAGRYIFGDYISGRMWALTYGNGSASAALLLDSPYYISSFGEATNGDMLVLTYPDGRIYRLTSPPASVGPGRKKSGSFNLRNNYPNPFNPVTNFDLHTEHVGLVRLDVLDVLGRVVATVMDEYKPAGEYRARWDASGFPSGVYIAQLNADGAEFSQRMVLVK